MHIQYLSYTLVALSTLLSLSLAQTPTTLVPQPTSTSLACNNSPALCSRPYDNITYLGAHNSAFIRDASTSFSTSGNHFFNSTTQLAAGVRMLTAQVHRVNDSTTTGADEWHLCHSSCSLLDAGPLRTWLGAINNWMMANPREVVTILLVNSDGATAADLKAEFDASRIAQFAYTPPSRNVANMEWPTLGAMLAANTRLVTFVASLPGGDNAAAPYLLDEFSWVFENEFENTRPSDFSCAPARPGNLAGNAQLALSPGRLFLQNHFLYEQQGFGIEIPDVDALNVTNSASAERSSLASRLAECTATYGRVPNYVLVDFFNVGPAILSVDTANGIVNPVGRQAVQTTPLERGAAGAAGRIGVHLGMVLAAAILGLGVML